MTSAQLNRFVWVAIPLLAAAGFVLDIYTPAGITDGVWYFIPLLLSAFVGGRFLSFVLAAVFSGLTMAGYCLSPPSVDPDVALINCCMGICMLWAVALMIFLRRRMETALQESEARIHSLFENMQEGFAHCRMIYKDGKPQDFIYLAVNRAFENVTGLKQVVGKRVTEVIPGIKEAHPELFEIYGRVASTGQPEKFEINLEASQMWLDISVYSPAKGCFVAIFENITRRKRAEEEMRKLSRAVEHSPASIVITDKAGNIEYVNPKFTEVTGYSAKEVLGKNPRILKSGEMPPEGYRRLWETVLSGKEWRGEFHNLRKNGELYWELAAISPIFNAAGKIAHFLAVKEDITERKRTEEKVREQAALLDKAQDAIFVMDMEGRITYWNKGAERMFGWTTLETTGKQTVDLLFRGVMTPQLQEAIKTTTERGEWVGELTEFTKEGKNIIVQGRSNIICDEQGRPKSILVIDTDITEKKKLEEQFLRAQRLESLGALAGGIAHDLNNVLTPLLISVQLLKEKISDADRQKLLEALETNVCRGANLVKQVLTFGRGIEGARIPVQPAAIVREIEQIIHETFPKSVKFELQSAPDLWTITGDPTQLHQVLLNLCVNARDAMPEGGKLSIHMENVVLDEAYAEMNPESKPGSYVTFKVADTGAGIPKATQNRMFEPFFSTKKPGHGTGLGLSTSLGIVRSHGGFIDFYSEEGRGSTFKVYLPANTLPMTAGDAVPAQTKLPCGHDELVLVVDDEESIRQIAQKMLERFGYRVLTAVNGAEAVSIYTSRQKEIAVVVTDLAMPVMDGPAAIVALKSINPEVKIIGSSGLASDGGMARLIGAGVRHFIPKPYTAETLLDTLHEVLNESPSK